MATQEKPGGMHMPSIAYFTVVPALLALSIYAMTWTLSAEGVLPQRFHKDVPGMAVRCVGLSVLPMIELVAVVIAFRVLTRAGDTLQHAESPLMKVHINSLTNTAEQTLVFALNLLAFSSLQEATAERLLLFTMYFVGARQLFWVGYLLFYATGFPPFRSPGMTVTIGVNGFLLLFNLTHFFSS